MKIYIQYSNTVLLAGVWNFSVLICHHIYYYVPTFTVLICTHVSFTVPIFVPDIYCFHVPTFTALICPDIHCSHMFRHLLFSYILTFTVPI